MPRAKRGFKARQRRNKIMKAAKGFWGGRRRLYKQAAATVRRSWRYETRDRRNKKDARTVASLDPDQRVRMVRVTKLLPVVMRQIEIVPTPKAVGIWMNDRKLGDYGPDLRQVNIPLGTSATLTFRNDACCFEKVIPIAARQQIQTLRVKLPWKPARLKVEVAPAGVEADVQVGSVVTRSGQLAAVPIPAYSEDGEDEVDIKVSAPGYATVARKVKVRANAVVSQRVELRKLP